VDNQYTPREPLDAEHHTQIRPIEPDSSEAALWVAIDATSAQVPGLLAALVHYRHALPVGGTPLNAAALRLAVMLVCQEYYDRVFAQTEATVMGLMGDKDGGK